VFITQHLLCTALSLKNFVVIRVHFFGRNEKSSHFSIQIYFGQSRDIKLKNVKRKRTNPALHSHSKTTGHKQVNQPFPKQQTFSANVKEKAAESV